MLRNHGNQAKAPYTKRLTLIAHSTLVLVYGAWFNALVNSAFYTYLCSRVLAIVNNIHGYLVLCLVHRHVF
jgi:hypothetical protein